MFYSGLKAKNDPVKIYLFLDIEDMDFDDIAPESDDEFEPAEYFNEVSGSRYLFHLMNPSKAR